MGCRGSKLGPEQEARIRPILRRRIEEFIARRNAGLSKKQLLASDGTISRDSEGEDEEEIIKEDTSPPPMPPSGLKDDHIFHHTQDCPPMPQTIAPSIDDNDKNNININDNHFVELKSANINGEKNVDEARILHNTNVSKGASQEEEEEGNVDDLEGFDLSYGSPSFRVYCVRSMDEELDDIADHLVSEECVIEDEKNDSCPESSSSNEVVVEKQTLKKHKRRRKFKRIAMPKGGRNILHSMHSFTNFPCNSNSSHLMEPAAA